jgi:pimeloyl-ACP methyl ester carboxylesterase
VDGRVGYARRGECAIAYRVLNPDGPAGADLLFLPGLISHVEVLLEEPRVRRFVERICAFARVTMMDRIGSGLSDPLDGPPDLEKEVEDVLAVLDAAGAGRATLMAYTSSASLAVQTAAGHPERVRGLVLYAGMYRTLADAGYDWARGPEERDAALEEMLQSWGSGANLVRPGAQPRPGRRDAGVARAPRALLREPA